MNTVTVGNADIPRSIITIEPAHWRKIRPMTVFKIFCFKIRAHDAAESNALAAPMAKLEEMLQPTKNMLAAADTKIIVDIGLFKESKSRVTLNLFSNTATNVNITIPSTTS